MKESAGAPKRDFLPVPKPRYKNTPLLWVNRSNLYGPVQGEGWVVLFEFLSEIVKRIPDTDIILIIGERLSGRDDNTAAVGASYRK